MPNVGTYRGVAIYYQEDRDRYRMWYTDNKGNKKPAYGKTKELVKANYDKIQEELRKGKYIANMPDTLLKLMYEMLEEKGEDRDLKDNSLNRNYDTAKIIEKYIKCNRKPIQKITADNLNEELKKLPNMKKFIQSKNKEEYRFSQSYLDKIYSLIREVFHYAVLKEKLTKEKDPFEVEGKVKKPKANKPTKEVKPFTRTECIKFLKQLSIEEPSQFIDIIKIQLMGFRIGETLALTNEDIDLEENKIFIETSLTKDKDDKTVRGDTTKTPSGKRVYPLTYTLREIIEPYYNKNKPKALLFSYNNKPINESNVCRVTKRVCAHARNKSYNSQKEKSKWANIKLKNK